jgi:hypothetical protein
MAWVERGGRGYEYKSIRRGRRVTSAYVGGGISAESAALFRRFEAARRAELEAERRAERTAWAANRDELAEAEARVIEIDEAYGELAELAMTATGWHRPQRGRWRRKRTMSGNIQATKANPPPMSEKAMGDLIDLIERSDGDAKRLLQEECQGRVRALLALAKDGDERTLPALRVLLARRPDHLGKLGIADFAAKASALAASGAKDVLIRDAFIREIEERARQLAGPDPSPLEVLLCERVALAHFDVSHRDIATIEAEMNGASPQRVEFLTKMRDRSTARFLAACKGLANIRRLALPSLMITVEASASTISPRSVESSETSSPRLRIGGGS